MHGACITILRLWKGDNRLDRSIGVSHSEDVIVWNLSRAIPGQLTTSQVVRAAH